GAVTAARRSEEMVASEELAAMRAPAATGVPPWRLAATAALPAMSEPAALAATLLEEMAATAVTAALAGRLMAATRLVAMAATEFCSLLGSGERGGGKAWRVRRARGAVMAETGSEEMAGSEWMA